MKAVSKKKRPFLEAKFFFRVSEEFRNAVDAVCEKEQVDISEMLRYLAESGLSNYIFRGFPGVMTDRAKLLDHLEKQKKKPQRRTR